MNRDFERAGIAWWNGLTVRERARWLRIANTCVPAEAYTCHLALLAAGDADPLWMPFVDEPVWRS